MVILYMPKLGKQIEKQQTIARSFTVFATIIGKYTNYCAVLKLLGALIVCISEKRPGKLTRGVLCWWVRKLIEDNESMEDR